MGTDSVRDEQVIWQTSRGALVGMTHTPADPAGARPGVVFCNAFGEERKSSALAMARMARAVAAAGFPALRFDYFGCGDSEGAFLDADVRTRREDIASAADLLKERAGCGQVVLLGLRLGATLALAVAGDVADCAGAVLIEPIVDGEKYLGGEMRRKLVRQMMTDGQGKSAREEMMRRLELDDAVLDMDGFPVRGATFKQLKALGIRSGEVGFAGPVLVCQLHFNATPKAELEAVCATCREAGCEVEMRCLVMQPIWSRIDVAVFPELDATVASWLSDAFPDR